jgi:hypothetical protein
MNVHFRETALLRKLKQQCELNVTPLSIDDAQLPFRIVLQPGSKPYFVKNSLIFPKSFVKRFETCPLLSTNKRKRVLPAKPGAAGKNHYTKFTMWE